MQPIIRFFEYLEEFNTVSVTVRLVLAAIMGGIIGMERGATKHAAGLRTFMLVCVGAALAQVTDIRSVIQFGTGDPMRLAQGVINGIGFLGVGTIVITGKSHIKGLTTAATLWTTAVLGISIGAGYLYSSIVTFILIVFVIKVMAGVSHKQMKFNRRIQVKLELPDNDSARAVMMHLQEKNYRVTEMNKKNSELYVALDLEIDLGKKIDHDKVIEELGELKEVEFVMEVF